MRSAAGEIATASRGVTILDQAIDLLDRHRRTFVLGLTQAQHPEHEVELLERVLDARQIAGADLTRVHRGVQRAHQLEYRPQRGRGVQIVLHRLGEFLTGGGDPRRNRRILTRDGDSVEPRQKIGEPTKRFFGLAQAGPGEVQLLAIVRGQQQVADR